jgi:neurotransmitter:Na+ symporter, NSS family
MRETWGSRFGFIMATAGFSIGLGNIWRFPYMTGENGGGAFVLLYLVLALAIGVPLMTMEVGLGRRAQLSPIAGFEALTGRRASPWNLAAWLGVTAAVAINAYYVMLIGWILGYFVMVSSGHFTGLSADEVAATYQSFTTTPGPVLVCTGMAIVLMTLVVRRGLGAGLERLARVGMPLLFVLLVVLTVRSLLLPGAWRGVAWYLTPDVSRIHADTVLAALGQVFYSIGIGMAAGFGFGSYMKRGESDVPGNVAIVVLCDTAVAVLAGFLIFPALFAFDLPPDAGPGLLFVTMTNLFARMSGGARFGGAFFLLLLIAGATSSIAVFEVTVATVMDTARLARGRATLVASLAWAALAAVVILGQAAGSTIRVAGLTPFDALDLVSTNYLLPVGGLLIAMYGAWVWGFDAFRAEVNQGAGRFRVTAVWRPVVVVLVPVAVGLVLLVGLGVFG